MTTQSFVLIKKSSLLPFPRCKTSYLFTDFIQDRREAFNWKQTTFYRRSKHMIEHNYSELFEGIPIFADISTSILQRYPISGLFPTAHSLTILLSIYEHWTAKERFIKQFYWLYSIEYTSSNCLSCSLYIYPVLYI